MIEIPKEFEGNLVCIGSLFCESGGEEVWHRGYIENGELVIYVDKYEYESPNNYDAAFPWGYLPNLPNKLVLCSFVDKTPASKEESEIINKFWKVFPEYIPVMMHDSDFKCNHDYEERPDESNIGLKIRVCKKCYSGFNICKKCKSSYQFHQTFSGYCPKCQKSFNTKIREFEKSIGYEPYQDIKISRISDEQHVNPQFL